MASKMAAWSVTSVLLIRIYSCLGSLDEVSQVQYVGLDSNDI